MNKIVLLACAVCLVSVNVLAQQGEWTHKKAKKWFRHKEWLGGAPVQPHSSIDYIQFAQQYHANKDAWQKAFAFLRDHPLETIAKGKYPIDGENVFATVTEDPSKDFEKTNWESHRKYIDLQCVITGDENMGKCPVDKATVTNHYDEKKDVANYTAQGKIYTIHPHTFILFFPSDAHRPNITPGGNKVVKKIVIKIRVAPTN